jgi:phosphoribosylformimino-5-aminoimidazole carboxamide ribotide isomerase
MRVIGVIDMREGRAVHARGGRRDAYSPIGVAACEPVDGDPLAVARAYVERLGVRELYVADLDAIGRGVGAMNSTIITHIAALGAPVLVDAGVSSAAGARAVMDAGASTVVVGLETLPGIEALGAVCASVGGSAVALSVDLRDGQPITMPDVGHSAWSAVEIAAWGATAGVGTIIVLDLARVGTGGGIDTDLLARVRRAVPGVTVLAGGGVRDASDLDRLASIGCDGALVATALLNGTIRLSKAGRNA